MPESQRGIEANRAVGIPIPAAHRRNKLDNKEAPMKIEFLSFLEWSLQLSMLLNVFMAGLCGFLVYQDRKAG